MPKTSRQIEDRELAAWKAANPVILVNVASVGTACGRFPTVDAAKREIARRGEEYVSHTGNHVYFRGAVYC